MRVSLDSNVWEAIFSPLDEKHASLRSAFQARRIEGYICAAVFRIEAIRKRDRAAYFARPRTDFRFEGIEIRDGHECWKMSFGPADHHHPGLSKPQASKLTHALASGIKLMRDINWMGLPSPAEIADLKLYVSESPNIAIGREHRQAYVLHNITRQGVGRALFEAMNGWNLTQGDVAHNKKFNRACAEWADAELVSAHIGYQNDVLCTNDHAGTSGRSIFDRDRRAWLMSHYGLEFRTLEELTIEVASESARNLKRKT